MKQDLQLVPSQTMESQTTSTLPSEYAFGLSDEQMDAYGYDEYKVLADPYWLLPPDDSFIVAMRNNPLDIYTEELMKDWTTKADLLERQEIVYKLWVAEMNATLQQLHNILKDSELTDMLSDAQTAWEYSVDTCIRIDKKLIAADGWSGDLDWVFPGARIQQYRERTFHLKYLLLMYTSDVTIATRFFVTDLENFLYDASIN